MTMLHRTILSRFRQSIFCITVVLVTSSAWAGNWADVPAELTVGEYLQLLFDTKMTRPESEAVNSFGLVSFYPSSSPQRALVLIIQTWRDDRVPLQDLRREIRKGGDLIVDHFKAIARHPLVAKRWRPDNPKSNVMVRHARLSDVRETIAVTVNGETVFDEDAMTRARQDAVSRGAVWSW